MRYKFILSNTAYKVMRASDAFAPQIYRAVSLTLMLKMPDGTPLKGQTININGTDMVTGSTGQVILTGDMGLTAKLHIVYNVTYIADVEVTYTAAAVYVGRSAGCKRCQDDRLEVPLQHKNKSRLCRYKRRGDTAWRR